MDGSENDTDSGNTSIELLSYEVQNEDTLAKIALRYGTTVGEISTVNHLSSHLLFPSQILYIPNKEKQHINSSNTVFIENSDSKSSLFPGHYEPLNFYTPLANIKSVLSISRNLLTLDAFMFLNIKKLEKNPVKLILSAKKLITRFKSNIDSNSAIFSKDIDVSSIYPEYRFKFKYVQSFRFYQPEEIIFKKDFEFSTTTPTLSIDNFTLKSTKKRFSSIPKSQKINNIDENLSIPILVRENNSGFLTPTYHRNLSPVKDEKNQDYQIFPYLMRKVKNIKRILSPNRTKISSVDEYPHFRKQSNIDHNKGQSFSKNSVRCSTSCLDIVNKEYEEFVDSQSTTNSFCHIVDPDKKDINIFFCICFKNNTNRDNIPFFNDFPHLYNFERPKVAFEINSNHLEYLQDFINFHLESKSSIDVSKKELNDKKVEENISKLSLSLNLDEIYGESKIFTHDQIDMIIFYLPSNVFGKSVKLGYSTEIHGTSIKTLYRNMLKFKDSTSILVILDCLGCLFGAILSSLPRISNTFYGSGECVLFKEEKDDSKILKFFPWSHKNNYFIKGDQNFFAIGCGKKGYGLWINEDLISGFTSPCETFENETLSKNRDFKSKLIEIWVFD